MTMKNQIGRTMGATAAVLIAGIGVWALTAQGAEKADAGAGDAVTAEVMREKLERSQRVLRGLALQDFALVRSNAERLVKLSHASGWAARQSPEYELFTVEFRRSASEMARAAEERNIDGVAMAYTQMTFSCVSCHKYMRGGRPSGAGTGG
jgi:cytochrome c556